MQSSRSVELWVGVLVALGLAALFMLAMKVSNMGDLFNNQVYSITAKFQNIGTLKVKAPVKMAGVRIGQVTEVNLDPITYEAVVAMQIDSQYRTIPKDSNASIFTAGVLGEQYVGLKEGAEEEYLTDHDQIMLTQPALVLEQLIGQFLVRFASGSEDKKP